MTIFRAGMLGSGPGWFEVSGVSAAELLVTDSQTPTNTIPVGSTLSYIVTDAADDSTVITGTATPTGTTAVVMKVSSRTVVVAPSVSKRYRERWYGTIDGTAIDVYRDARATRHAAQLRAPPIGTLEVLAQCPAMSDYPSGFTSWDTLLSSVWARVSRRLFHALPAGEVWAPDDLAEPTMCLFLAMWNEQAATFANTTYLDAARFHRAQYEAFWERAGFSTDSDGNGTVDVITPAGGASSAPGPRT